MSTQRETAIANHPLDPLTADEIEGAVEIFEAETDLGDEVQYHNVTLAEPPKAVVKSFEPGDSFDREVTIVAREAGRPTRRPSRSLKKPFSSTSTCPTSSLR